MVKILLFVLKKGGKKMPLYYYKAINQRGDKVEGVVDALSIDEAEIKLIVEGFSVEKIREANILDELNKKFVEFQHKFSKVKLEDLIVFTRQFATLFSAGVPVLTALTRLKNQSLSFKLREALGEIIKDVEAGSSLYMAFSKHKDVFSPLYVNMIRVGEEGGVLDIILQRLSTILEADLDTRNRIKSATRYPKMVIFAITIAFTIIITFVIPKFISLFARFNAQLPLPTRILIWVNHFVTHYWFVVIGIISAGVFAFKKYKSTPRGKLKIDEISLKLPIIGNILTKIYISRMARILGLLYKSGISLILSLEIVSEVTGNDIYKRELLKIKDAVARGERISDAFMSSSFFPPIVADMISSGEDTGQLDEMLFKVADYYDEETDYLIKNLSQMIEPILLAFIAGMVLILALGVFLPMWNMMKVFKGG